MIHFNNLKSKIIMENQNELVVKMVFDAWNNQQKTANKLLETLTDEQLQQDVAAGKNSGIYLLGHLTSVHDDMHRILNFGAKLYPDLDAPFIKSADKSGQEFPSATLLRKYWNDVNNSLTNHFGKLNSNDWFTRHMSVSEEDFAKEPHRNKLNIIINRTNHMAYHLGQMTLLKK